MKDIGGTVPKALLSGTKRKRGPALSDDEYFDDAIDEVPGMSLYADDELEPQEDRSTRSKSTRHRSSAGTKGRKRTEMHAPSDEEPDGDWSFTMADEPSTSSSAKSKPNASLPPLGKFSYDPSTSAPAPKQKSSNPGETKSDKRSLHGVAVNPAVATPKAAAFTPASGAARVALSSSLSRSKSMTRPGVAGSPSGARRGVFTPSTSSFARPPFTNGKAQASTGATAAKTHPAQPPNRLSEEVDDIIEINSDTDF